MIYGNPVRQAYIRPPGAPAKSGNFRVTLDFGPTSLGAEPSITWPGGEGFAAGYYAHFHRGDDFGDLRCGDDVIAMAAGTVKYAQKSSDGAIIVMLDHGGGNGSAYVHLANEVVTVGQKVVKGQKLGVVGDTGNSTACHLHVSIKSGVDWSRSFFSNTNGHWLNLWPRLAQNVTIAVRDDGAFIRTTAGSGTTFGPAYAKSMPDGTIRRLSDNASLGAFSQKRAWGGTVNGATYPLSGGGKTWEKISIASVWYYIASPLAALSAS